MAREERPRSVKVFHRSGAESRPADPHTRTDSGIARRSGREARGGGPQADTEWHLGRPFKTLGSVRRPYTGGARSRETRLPVQRIACATGQHRRSPVRHCASHTGVQAFEARRPTGRQLKSRMRGSEGTVVSRVPVHDQESTTVLRWDADKDCINMKTKGSCQLAAHRHSIRRDSPA